jgi:rsbT co-antagonist protein RsbR
MIQMLELPSIEVTITGIRPEIAQTWVQLGIDFSDLATFGKLKHALKFLYNEN